MLFIFIYKLSSEVGQKFNFSAWFFSFFENTIVTGFLGVCWLPLSCIPNFHSPLLVALGLVRVSSRKLLGYHTSGGNLHILGLRNKCFFCISCHASVDLLPSTSQNNPLLDQGFASPAARKSHPGHWYTWGDPLGNVKVNATEGAQFAKYITLWTFNKTGQPQKDIKQI